jgi:hypothetical protein
MLCELSNQDKAGASLEKNVNVVLLSFGEINFSYLY